MGQPGDEFAPTVRQAAAAVLPIFLTIRIALAIWPWAVRQVISEPMPPEPTLRPYLGVQPETNSWLEPWQRWDTLHYQAIADRGYLAFDGALFTPPLFPFLMWILGAALGGHTLLAGIVISNLAYLGALIAVYLIACRELQDPITARRAILFLAVFPTSFFFLAAYTESLLLLGASTALLAYPPGKWAISAAAGAAAALSRLVGALVTLPLAYLGRLSSRQTGSLRPFAPAVATIAAALVLPIYAWLGLGMSPLAPLAAQAGRSHGGLSLPGVNLAQGALRLLSGDAFMADVLDLAFLLLFVACGVVAWRRYSASIGLLYLGLLAPLLVRSAGSQPLLGSSRYVIVLFPAFFIFAEWASTPWRRRLVLYPSTVGLLFLSGQFAIWGWVG